MEFTATEAELHAEAASNAHLPASAQLDAAEHARLLALGWEDVDAQENYSRSWRRPVDIFELARLAARTLLVYGDEPETADLQESRLDT